MMPGSNFPFCSEGLGISTRHRVISTDTIPTTRLRTTHDPSMALYLGSKYVPSTLDPKTQDLGVGFGAWGLGLAGLRLGAWDPAAPNHEATCSASWVVVPLYRLGGIRWAPAEP